MPGLIKNTSGQNVTFCLVNASTGAALTGATVTAQRSLDGTAAACTGSVTEQKISGTGYGQYKFAPSQADTNGTDVGYLFTATGAIPVNVDFHTDTVDANGYLNVNAQDHGGTSQTGRDIGASVLLSNGTGTGQLKLSAGYVSPNWGDVGNPSTANDLTGTKIAGIDGTTNTLDALQTAQNSAHGAGSWATATGFATPTNITAGTITTVTNLTNAPTAGDFTATMKTSIGTAVAASAVASVTGNVGGNVTGSVGSVSGDTKQTGDSYAFLTTALTEAYRANGATGTLAQLLYEILGNIVEQNNSGTTRTVKKTDHSTTAATYTYDSSTPNTITRAS
jgi:hypothetical protein